MASEKGAESRGKGAGLLLLGDGILGRRVLLPSLLNRRRMGRVLLAHAA